MAAQDNDASPSGKRQRRDPEPASVEQAYVQKDDGLDPAHCIFTHLCDKIQEAEDEIRHIVHYLVEYGVPKVWRYINSIIQSNKDLKHVVTGKRWQDVHSLLSIKGHCDKPHQIGWYLGVVTSPEDDEYLKKYVGQSDHMGHWMRHHRADLKAGANVRQLFHRVAGTHARTTIDRFDGIWASVKVFLVV